MKRRSLTIKPCTVLLGLSDISWARALFAGCFYTFNISFPLPPRLPCLASQADQGNPFHSGMLSNCHARHENPDILFSPLSHKDFRGGIGKSRGNRLSKTLLDRLVDRRLDRRL